MRKGCPIWIPITLKWMIRQTRGEASGSFKRVGVAIWQKRPWSIVEAVTQDRTF
jgi:hypothetical protein